MISPDLYSLLYINIASYECFIQEISERMQKHAGCIAIAKRPETTRGADYNQKSWLVYLIRLNLYDDIIQLLQYTGLGPDLIDRNEFPDNVQYKELITIITSLPNYLPKYHDALTVPEKKALSKEGYDLSTTWYDTSPKNTNNRALFNVSATTNTIRNPVSVLLYGYLNYMMHVMDAETDDDEPDNFSVPNPFRHYLYYTAMKNEILNKRNMMRLGETSPEGSQPKGREIKSFSQLRIVDRHPKRMYSLVTIAQHIFKPLSQDAYEQPSFGEKGFVFDCARLKEYFPPEDRTTNTGTAKGKMNMTERLQKATEEIEIIELELAAMKKSIAKTPNIEANESIDRLEKAFEKLKNFTDTTKKKKGKEKLGEE